MAGASSTLSEDENSDIFFDAAAPDAPPKLPGGGALLGPAPPSVDEADECPLLSEASDDELRCLTAPVFVTRDANHF